jgi:hypothetical protein
MQKKTMSVFGLIALIGLSAVSQSSFAATPLVRKQFRLASIEVTPMGPVFLVPDASTKPNNTSGCIHDEIAISRTKPNFNELYSLAMAAMLAGKTVEISSGDYNTDVCSADGWGRTMTNDIKILN